MRQFQLVVFSTEATPLHYTTQGSFETVKDMGNLRQYRKMT